VRYRVLVVEDDKVDRMAFERFVKDENPPYDYTLAGSVSETKRILGFKEFDVVIADYMLGDGTVFDVFDLIKDTPIIIVTGSGNEKVAVEAMKSGAYDYLIKDPERNYFKVLPITIENAIKHKRAETEVQRLHMELENRVVERTAQLEAANEKLRYEIIERRKIEEELEASERRFRALVENAFEGVAIFNANGTFLYVSPSEMPISGYSPEELVGRDCIEFIHPDDIQPMNEAFRELIQNVGGIKSVEFRYRHKDGSWCWLEATLTNLMSEPAVRAIVANYRDITERKQADEKLKKSLSLLHGTLESTADGILVVNMEGRIETFNQKFVELWSIPSSVMASGDDSQAIAFILEQLKDPQGFIKKVNELYAQPEANSYDVIEFNDGRVFERYSQPQRIGERIVGRVWSFRDATERVQVEEALQRANDDLEIRVKERTAELRETNERLIAEIAERKRTEEALERNERKFRTLVENLPQRVALKDRNSIYLSCNTSYASDLKIAPDEIVGKTDYDFYPRELAEKYRADDRMVMETGRISEFDEAYIQDGREMIIHTVKVPMRDEAGGVVGVLLIFWDITESRRMEIMKERLSKDKLLLLDSAGEGIFGIDFNGACTFINKAALKMLGYKYADEFLGKNAHEILHHSHPDGSPYSVEECPVYITLRSGQSTRVGDEVFWRSDGTSFPTGYASYPIIEEGKIRGAVVTFIDITERKRADEAIRRANEELTISVKQLEERNRNTTLLNEMSDLLQSCQTGKEAYAVIAEFAHQLFPMESGALYILNASEDLVEAVAVWGDPLSDGAAFTPDECWALRRGKMHVVRNSHSGVVCQHLSHLPPSGYICVPVMAQGKALGILYLQPDMNGRGQPEGHWEQLRESARQQLALALARNIALSLVNLKLRETLHSQAIRDVLTGLFNRRYMEEMLNREIHRAERKATPLGIIMLDIDHFKQFNDAFGHAAGDALLRELGSFLKARIRGGDIACRYGGEEFMLILPETSLDDTRQRAEQLREEFKHLNVKYNGQSTRSVTLSLGVAVFPEHGLTGEAVSRAADLALYQAKRGGRDRVVVGQPIVNDERLSQSPAISH
jgi:diguanylate cyclase (GGDEF)-like protein/PAS domain S-box-containing protein